MAQPGLFSLQLIYIQTFLHSKILQSQLVPSNCLCLSSSHVKLCKYLVMILFLRIHSGILV